MDSDGSIFKYASVENGYLNALNRKILICSDDYELGYTHIYSLQELRDKTLKALGEKSAEN